MDNDTYDDRIPRINDQTNIKFIVVTERLDIHENRIKELGEQDTDLAKYHVRQETINGNLIKRLEETEDEISKMKLIMDKQIMDFEKAKEQYERNSEEQEV